MTDSSDRPQNNRAEISRRQQKRCALFSELSIVYEGWSEVMSLRPSDLSTRGMFLNTPNYFPVGAVLKVRFRLSRSDVVIQARAEVRYTVPGAGVGVEFLELSPGAGRAIEKELEMAGESPFLTGA